MSTPQVPCSLKNGTLDKASASTVGEFGVGSES